MLLAPECYSGRTLTSIHQYYAGRLDHWHLHMSGLKKVLDLNGGMTGLPPWLLAEMYK
jgi:hypothetical protein